MSRALITGLDGFTGQYLKTELEEAGWEVCGIGRADLQNESCYRKVDLADRAGLAALVDEVRPDAVVHLAAIAFVAHGSVEEVYRTNIVGTHNLLEALASCAKRPDAVLLASSANVYGNSTIDPIDESVPPQPTNDYAVSKLAMECLARLWFEKLPVTITRPFNYTGVGQPLNFLLPKIVDHFRRGAGEIELGNLDVARDFSDVRTVAAVYRRLLQLAPAGEVFNICSGRACTLRDVLAMMGQVAGYEIVVKVNPAFVRENEVKYLRGSNSKLMAALGGMELIPIEETLRWMYEAGARE